uniref:DUF4201 domain-containing protein n=1 Tax=Schistosoma mansoni TaxID=6183 RepID=A0A3Q0KM96_SCHMA
MEPKLKEKQRLDAIMIDENELKEHKSTVRQYDLIPVEEKANILKLKIINELESKYREQILCLQSDLQYYQDQNRLLIDTNQNLNKTLNDERLEFKNLKLLYEAEISSLKKIKDDQSIQINQLTSIKTNEDKKDKIQSKNDDQLLKVKNMELETLCTTQKNQLCILTEQMNKLRNEFMNQCQVSVDSTKNQVRSELQIEQFINSIRTELFDLRNEVQTQRFEIENQRNELMNKSKALNHELNLLSTRLTNSNPFETTATTNYNMTTTTNPTSRKEDQDDDQDHDHGDDEDGDKKIQQIIRLFRNHFMIHMNEFENKVTSITERLNLEVNQMQTFKIYANSLMEKINATESKQSSLILTDRHNQRILKHLDISNAIRNKMQQFVEDSRKKKRALCLRIVLLKRKLNFFEYEMEKLRQENNNLKRNVSISEYERVCMAYKDLYRRHQEYERIILHSDNQKFLIKSNTLQ